MLKELLFGGAGCVGKLGDFALLVLRVFTGISLAFAHGFGKVQNPEQIISGAEGMGFPVPILFGWSAILSEFLGGILLALGLLTRPAALFIGITMAVAAFVHHSADPFAKKELALLYLGVMILFLCTGGGQFSIDRLVRK